MGLGDHLVTIQVLERPSSPSHGPPKSFKIAVCRWLSGIWCAHKLLLSMGRKWKILNFFDIVTTHNDEIFYVKHVLDHHYVFSPYLGVGGRGGGGARGLGQTLPIRCFSLGSSKMEISETDFFFTF